MCLFIKSKSTPTPRIAKKPIKVWKRLDKFKDHYKSPYKGMVYKPSNIYASEIGQVFPINLYMSLWSIHEGLHSFTNKKRAYGLACLYTIVEMIIPVGAVYYRGENHEIVSDILIFP